MTRKAARKPRVTSRARVRMNVDERRQQLLMLGLRAFSELPYDRVSTDEIAEEAGISRGLLFHYFATKRDFYVAVLEAIAEELLQDAAWNHEGVGYERLLAGVKAYFQFVERRADFYVALLRGGVGTDSAGQEVVESTRRRFIETIRANMPAPSPDDEAALRASLRAWIGMLEGLALDWASHRDLPRGQLVEMALRAFAFLVPGAMAYLPKDVSL